MEFVCSHFCCTLQFVMKSAGQDTFIHSFDKYLWSLFRHQMLEIFIRSDIHLTHPCGAQRLTREIRLKLEYLIQSSSWSSVNGIESQLCTVYCASHWETKMFQMESLTQSRSHLGRLAHKQIISLLWWGRDRGVPRMLKEHQGWGEWMEWGGQNEVGIRRVLGGGDTWAES